MSTDNFESMLQRAVVARLREIVAEESAAASERIKTRIKEAAPAIACGVMKRFEVVAFKDRLEIVVRLEDKT